ncbi:protein of unknown function [Kyrpidia spormannii]|uniref:Uncharacterized protein n=1 Tax=Kyrpidia spormannii TaxID=2055160 RepID=A0ACA8ZA93_9BACL|nr:protein of unknown function [Kyrpidia spormannii]
MDLLLSSRRLSGHLNWVLDPVIGFSANLIYAILTRLPWDVNVYIGPF